MKAPLAISTLALAFVISACQPVAPPLEPTTPPKAEVQPSPTTVAPTSTTVPPTAPPPTVPANAIVVAPNGNDNAAGTSAAPLRTATKAISRATSGSTNQTPSGQNKLGPSEDRWKLRSVTYTGIAEAMAEQWGYM